MRLRPTFGHGPADRVARRPQHQREEPSCRALPTAETNAPPDPRTTRARVRPGTTVAPERPPVARQPARSPPAGTDAVGKCSIGWRNSSGQRLPAFDERRHELAVRFAVLAQRGAGLLQRWVKRRRRAVVEGMRHGDLRLNPFQPVPGQRQGLEKRRPEGQRMDGRAEVVDKAGQRQFARTRAAAEGGLRFEHADAATGLREGYGGGQAVRARADHHGIQD